MKKLDLRELQETELEMLILFDNFCKKYNIKYSLAAGTMIGAVRHKGFIPWDDDIDIFMVREEYDKLCEIIKGGERIDNDINILFPCSEKNFYPFVKVVKESSIVYEKLRKREDAIGVWLDIFPIDPCGNSYEEALENCKYMEKLARKLTTYHLKYPNNSFYNIVKNIYIGFINIFCKKQLNFINDYYKEYRGNSGDKFWGTLTWACCDKDFYPRKVFEEYIKVEFEGHKFMMFKEFDSILSSRYGDYMTMPPVEKRVSHEPEAYLL